MNERTHRSLPEPVTMVERYFLESPPPTLNPLPGFSSLPVSIDESLLQGAATRRRACSEGLRQLCAGVPSVRDTLDRLLREKLGLDGQQCGLLFHPTKVHAQRFVSLTAACAFVVQHPRLEEWLDNRCRLSGVSSAHALSALTPSQVLARFQSLEPVSALDERWQAYWESRAPGTPRSRRAEADRLYRGHVEASAQMAFARRTVTAEQLEPLWSLMGEPQTRNALDESLRIELPVLRLSNGVRVKPAAAWVISRADDAAHLLYVPGHVDAIQAFTRRSDLQIWLAQRPLVPAGLPIENLQVEYVPAGQSLTMAFNEWLSQQQMARIAALRNGSDGKRDLAEHGPLSLDIAERIDRQRNLATFSAPPGLDSPVQAPGGEDEPSLFGNLHADAPWSPRQAAVKRELDALESLTVEDALQSFRALQSTQESAEQAADLAARALLYRERTLDVTTFNRQFTALYNAHQQGLRAEAQMQRALNQISVEEHSLLTLMLGTPDGSDAGFVAASLKLSMTESVENRLVVNHHEINGAFVLMRRQPAPASVQSLLLYWPGSGGGLQRFADRQTLEQQLFKLYTSAASQTLELIPLSGDPLQYALNQLTGEFETRAATIRQRYTEPSQARYRADELEQLRSQTLALLQVPIHGARRLAMDFLLDQQRSTTLATQLPAWLRNLPESERSTLKDLIQAWISAMNRSHELLTVTLPPREDFTRQHLQERLRRDFSLKGYFSVQLDLPDSVTLQRQSFNAPGAPGTPQKLVPIPSATRSKMSLETLAQLNIDNTPSMNLEPLLMRLRFMQVEVSASDDRERSALIAGITLSYLRKLLPELDLPKAYEQLIYSTFKGSIDEPPFRREHRQECLLEPWRLMLKLQGRCAWLQHQIDEPALHILDTAIDADTDEAWNNGDRRIVLLPAFLAAGGADTPGEGPATLSGVTFIEEQVGGTTLLYLPDAPDGRFLRGYDSLEAARKDLFNRCSQDTMIRYLASRALQGSVRAHENRIAQAVEKRFDGMIGVGLKWSSTTSLAAHLLDAHMGRLIEAHRGTSRSNDALYLERYALNGPRVFNYLKMALGLVPFVGTALGLYDAWVAANQAVAAFLRGKVGDGLAEIESLLLCLIDAAIDIVPGAGAALNARLATRTRQLRNLATDSATLTLRNQHQTRRIVERFAGYEYEKPLSLAGLQPVDAGVWRNVYRHADGDFIVRQGRIFQVEWSRDSRNWRLTGTARKTYKQPIALDEAGNWDTWFGVYGTAFEGGGLGGGGVLGHLADTLEPLWPEVIRARLTPWWTDRVLRRHVQLTNTADDLMAKIRVQIPRHDVAINNYIKNTSSAPLRELADLCCISDIALARRRYQTLTEIQPLTHGNKHRETIRFLSDSARIVADRYRHRIYYSSDRATRIQNRIDELTHALDELAPDAISERLDNLETMRKLRVKFVDETEHTGVLMAELNQWYGRITYVAQRSEIRLKIDVDDFNQRLTDSNLRFLKTCHRMEIVKNYARAKELSWIYLQQQAYLPRAALIRALYVQYSLPQTEVTRVQRNQILNACLETYTTFQQQMKAWITRHPGYFHEEVVEPLLAGIDAFAEQARRAIIAPPSTVRLPGRQAKKAFLTEDNQVLIGVEQWEPRSRKRQFALSEEGQSGEVWEQMDNGRFRLRSTTAPQPAPKDLSRLVTDARLRLDAQDAYLADVRNYAKQNMLPVDLEHMMTIEADELLRRARDIEALASQNPIIRLLHDKAAELRTIGRQLRTAQALKSRNPTDGMLVDLIDQHAVEVRKRAALKTLGKRPDGRRDYMQEYEIWNLTQNPPQLLWYAHFHYSKASPRFIEFEKAHLKLPEHRSLTHADNPDLPYADIGKRSAALPFFEAL